MIDSIREEATCLKAQLAIKLEKHHRDRLPSEESRRPLSPLRRRRSDFSPN
jgi:hypothetical protein